MSAKPRNEKFVEEAALSDEDRLPSPDDPSEQHEQIETLNKALQEAQAKADAHWERLLRKEAELQNIQRRAEQDVDSARKFAIERFAGELLSVMDALEQGLAYSGNTTVTVEALVEGMKLTQTSLMGALEKQGITEINPIGEPFDPTYQEALTMQVTDTVTPNHVVQVVQKGYLLNQRLLRPARVIVSKAPA